MMNENKMIEEETNKAKAVGKLLVNTLWQYIDKEHIDKSCSDEKWQRFVEQYEDHFAEETSLLAQDLYRKFEVDDE